jgi:hypothetical protein
VTFLTDQDPEPKAPDTAAPAVAWPVTKAVRIPALARPPAADVAAVMERRRSVRRMSRASLREIANMMAWVLAPSRVWSLDNGTRSRRMAASAGALHVVEPILIPPVGRRAFRIDGLSARMEILEVSDAGLAAAFRRKVAELVPDAAGCHAVVLAADFVRASAFYDAVDSLVLRDAGALLQTLHLASEAYRLSAVPLGILGTEAIESILPAGSGVRAVGVMVIGRGDRFGNAFD